MESGAQVAEEPGLRDRPSERREGETRGKGDHGEGEIPPGGGDPAQKEAPGRGEPWEGAPKARTSGRT